MNSFFVSSIEEINQSIPQSNFVSMIRPTSSRLNRFEPVTKQDLLCCLDKMKSKSGLDNVNADIIRFSIELLGDDITNLVNSSLETGICPETWKFTVVRPIPKVTNSNDVENLRPVNMAPILDKLLQNVVKKQLVDYMETNNLLTEVQSGFRRNHSCETAVNLVLSKWKVLKDKKKVIVVVFLDLKRAFETLDRHILLQKMHSYGVRGNVLKWFESWLTGRTQFTTFEGVKSDPIEVNLGVPQGTPLSCDMFNIYFNDIVLCLLHCYLNLFADDAALWIEADTLEEALRLVKIDLQRICKYLTMNKLKLNVKKSKLMVIGAETDQVIDVEGEVLECVESFKYLGVIIDKNLTFKENFDYVLRKLATKVSFLRRQRKMLDTETALLLYKALVAPHLDYCSSILFLANETQLKEMQKVQNRALRIILKKDRYANVETMLSTTDLLDVKQRIYYNSILLLYKAKMNLLPEYISCNLRLVQDSQQYTLRRNNQYRLPALQSSASQNSLFYKGLKYLNERIQLNIASGDNLVEFKSNLIAYVKSAFTSH